jgi:hypothetical protein
MNANRERNGNTNSRLRKLFIWGLIVAGLFLPATVAFANHNVCTIKAGDREVWVRVFDLDPDGNIKRGYGSSGFYSREVLWDGMLAQGQRSEIKSSSGQIRYDYKASSDDRPYGDNSAPCSHGEVIVVP